MGPWISLRITKKASLVLIDVFLYLGQTPFLRRRSRQTLWGSEQTFFSCYFSKDFLNSLNGLPSFLDHENEIFLKFLKGKDNAKFITAVHEHSYRHRSIWSSMRVHIFFLKSKMLSILVSHVKNHDIIQVMHCQYLLETPPQCICPCRPSQQSHCLDEYYEQYSLHAI